MSEPFYSDETDFPGEPFIEAQSIEETIDETDTDGALATDAAVNSTLAEPTSVQAPVTVPGTAPTLNPTLGTLMALGVTLDETTVCLLENVSGIYRLVGWTSRQREPGASLTQDAAQVCRQLGIHLDRALWDEDHNTPFLQSPDPIRYPPLEHFAVGVSPRPRMRVQLLGLSRESIGAARQALTSAPLHLSGIIQLDRTMSSGALATQFADQRPEALIIVGGYDDPDPATHTWILTLCRYVGQALSRLSPGERPAVFYAGNQWAAMTAEALLYPQEGPLTFARVNNVLPYPGHIVQTELPVVLSQLYWQFCQRMPGFAQLSRWITAPGHVANLESSFAQLVRIWMEYHGLPRLHGLYCTRHWWLHVWAEAATGGVQLRFVKPDSRPQGFADWPPLQLVSGSWPRQLWPRPTTAWWDRHRLAPLLTTIGQVAPQAVLQALEEDVLAIRRQRFR
ncbi:MAG TPA: glutamate mutase L [Caldilineaceae bacterium]|nr:glutamate mutase L [Caldilineaceae bacterium]